jgi:hypothetical protein
MKQGEHLASLSGSFMTTDTNGTYKAYGTIGETWTVLVLY